ncbi:MAG: DUF5333 domain-containing protein [Aestuariivita sp.]|nr:DUF5333 domain-containing protein [Aestuariivita sp.]
MNQQVEMDYQKRIVRWISMVCVLCYVFYCMPVCAKPPLNTVKHIDDGLFDVAVANVIRKRCDNIEGRFFKAIFFLQELKSDAYALGYKDADIEAFIDSDVEKERIKMRGQELFSSRGVDPQQLDDFCQFGLEEIEKQSRIGVLLKAK